MGSTVSTAKLAAAFATPQGPFYVLFEQTYEKNVHPHESRWGCVAIGEVTHVMEKVFRSAAACEGGMLKGASGRDITPEGYIAGWLKELSCPVEYHDHDVVLECSSSYRAAIPEEKLQAALTTLAGLGRQGIASKIRSGERVSLSMHEDGKLIQELYETLSLAPWRIIQSYMMPICGARREDLGYQPAKANGFDMTMPSFRKISETEQSLLMQKPDKRWVCNGWSSGYMSDYVNNLWKVELKEPGSYRARIKAFRSAMKNAPLIPNAGVEIIVDTSVEVRRYESGVIKSALDAMQHVREGSIVRIPVHSSCPLDYHATALPAECTSWMIPGSDEMVQNSLFGL